MVIQILLKESISFLKAAKPYERWHNTLSSNFLVTKLEGICEHHLKESMTVLKTQGEALTWAPNND